MASDLEFGGQMRFPNRSAVPMITAEQLARDELNEPAERERSLQYGKCVVSTWRGRGGFPAMLVTICENGDDVYVASKDKTTLQRVLKDIRPDLGDVAGMVVMLGCVLPMGVTVLDEGCPPYLRSETGERNRPSFDGSEFLCYCNDFRSGKVLLLRIDSDYQLCIEVAGSGLQVPFL
jgi:hypothetical protein